MVQKTCTVCVNTTAYYHGMLINVILVVIIIIFLMDNAANSGMARIRQLPVG